jgi:hypothetical protein
MLKGSELDRGNSTSDSLERLRRRTGRINAGQRLCRCDFHLKTALQTLREHDQESWVLFVDLVKAYDTVNREMLWKILTTLEYQKA